MDLTALAATHLEHGRAGTLDVLAPFDDEELRRQVSPLMSPLCWDLAHIGHYEELWLLRQLHGAAPTDERYDDLYDAFRHPRRERAGLPILDPDGARAYVADVRARVLDTMERGAPDAELARDAFVYGMVVQHEHQHQETMLATIGLMDRPYPVPGNGARRRFGDASTSREVRLPGARVVIGTDDEPWAYDNERPAHLVDVAPFRIDVTPVTNAAYRAFVEAGGYDDPRHWSPAGWSWRHEAGLEHPDGWQREGDGSWSVRRFGHRLDLVADEPVEHVCWYEAEAFATWAGKRLPTEAEWEYAASWTPDGVKRRYPWGDDDPTVGRARLGREHWAPSAVDAHPAGASPHGVLAMVGDVWEWTSSTFHGYPGFRSFPYREYSEVFFGDEYRVLRGGSWATHPSACRTTFRNWDFPVRRQIFCGFRCARDD
ncbi:MAG TPA: ergothioneine biosynthesis protein EgtB [Acidimicrobiia bacterium]